MDRAQTGLPALTLEDLNCMATGHYVVKLARGYQTNIQERVVQTGYIQQQGNYLDSATYHNDAGQLPAYIQAYQWTKDQPPQNYDPVLN